MTVTTRQVEAACAKFRLRTGELVAPSVIRECLEAAERERVTEGKEASGSPGSPPFFFGD